MIMTDKVLEIAQLGLSITDKSNSENIVIRKGRRGGKAVFDIIYSLVIRKGRREGEAIFDIISSLNINSSKIEIFYDKEADVLYISFNKPKKADDSEITNDDIIIRYKKGKIIGITILNASRFKKLSKSKFP
jgi:uncharacterized protein YuzE